MPRKVLVPEPSQPVTPVGEVRNRDLGHARPGQRLSDERKRPLSASDLELQRVGAIPVEQLVPVIERPTNLLGELGLETGGRLTHRPGHGIIDQAFLGDLDVTLPAARDRSLVSNPGSLVVELFDDLREIAASR